ncbi:MAG TPA: phenylalanine--tRNA ligase subunit beta [Alphaproteobacteria bacterium]|nr:phenylalanine--tRNA ligase subunit beta [Alphaproteobacteria bacterium]
MKFTQEWLKEHLDTEASLTELTDCLTRIGLELEAIEDPAKRLEGFKVAHVVHAEPHPDADRLKILQVDVGDGQLRNVVCGAPNARQGLIGILAQPGCVVPSTGDVLGKGKIRGVESQGMMCSGRELELSDDHDGIIELDDGQPGMDAAEILGQTDPVVDIAITPNRPDALGVRGIARDLAAAGLGRLKTLARPEFAEDGAIKVDADIKLDKDHAWRCPLFIARPFEDVTNSEAPAWMASRLKAIGNRSISSLVDITNWSTMTHARPLHVFDADKITGQIHVRMAKQGEELLALDEKTYQLDPEDLVIADDHGPVAIAGVIGGLNTGCTASTKRVILETAYFDPIGVARTGRRHNIISDARYRFERGIDPAFALMGDQLATAMILEICGGRAGEAVVVGAVPQATPTIDYDPERLKKLTGMDVPPDQQARMLQDLGFEVRQGDIWQVVAPSWRPDIHGAADLVEEITRLVGLDDLPLTPLPNLDRLPKPVLTATQRRNRRLRHMAAGLGLRELVTWSFLSSAHAQKFGGGDTALKLDNPISSELSDMRPSLIPNLLDVAARNIDRGFDDLALFELGPVYHGRKPEDQAQHFTAILVGKKRPDRWHGESRDVDVFDAKALAEAMLGDMAVPTANLMLLGGDADCYHPGRFGYLSLGPKNKLGCFGELHPAVLASFGITQRVMVVDLFLDQIPLPKSKGTNRAKLDRPELQSLRKDMAFILAKDVPAGDVVRAAKAADKQLITEVAIFDVFTGGALDVDEKSLAIRLTLQPQDKSLTDEDIAALLDKVAEKVGASTGGRLRG